MRQSGRTIEPMLAIRRQLIEFADGGTELKRSLAARLWLKSSKTARQANHLQSSWEFLVRAKELDEKSLEVSIKGAIADIPRVCSMKTDITPLFSDNR